MAKSFALRNATSGALVATAVERANDPLSRAIGLLARRTIAPDEGLWLSGCSAVHTLGMRATLDLYFLDRAGVVVAIVPGVRPQRLSVSHRGSKSVVELGTARAPRAVSLGDRLELE